MSTPRLKDLYIKEIQPSLKSKFGFKNLYMGPKIEKIILNMGLGLDGNDSKIIKSCEEDLSKITGQKPVTTKFKKSIRKFYSSVIFIYWTKFSHYWLSPIFKNGKFNFSNKA